MKSVECEALERRVLLSASGAAASPISFETVNDLQLTNADGSKAYGIFAMIAADVNGDGRPDLLSLVYDGNEHVGAIAVQINRGRGLSMRTRYIPGIHPTSFDGLVAGDFNGDGKLDLAVEDYRVKTVHKTGKTTYFSDIAIFLGNGDGTFRRGQKLQALYDGSNLITGDFNGDGKVDLAWRDAAYAGPSIDGPIYDPKLAVALGRGDGTFAPTIFRRGDVLGSPQFAMDVNRDGKTDILAQQPHGINVALSLGDGRFTNAGLLPGVANNALIGSAVVEDVNGDGRADLIIPQLNLNNSNLPEVALLLGRRRHGGFLRGPTVEFGDVAVASPCAVIGDFNGDGKIDGALVSVGTSPFSVIPFQTSGDATFLGGSPQPAGGSIFEPSIAVADLNGDGKADLIITGPNATEHILFA